jgi:hypothetical protein
MGNKEEEEEEEEMGVEVVVGQSMGRAGATMVSTTG